MKKKMLSLIFTAALGLSPLTLAQNATELVCSDHGVAFPADRDQFDQLGRLRANAEQGCLEPSTLDERCSCLAQAQLDTNSSEFLEHQEALQHQLRQASLASRIQEIRGFLASEFPLFLTPPQECQEISMSNTLAETCRDKLNRHPNSSAAQELRYILQDQNHPFAQLRQEYEATSGGNETLTDSADYRWGVRLLSLDYSQTLISSIHQSRSEDRDFDYSRVMFGESFNLNRSFDRNMTRQLIEERLNPDELSSSSGQDEIYNQYRLISTLFQTGVVNEHFHRHMQQAIMDTLKRHQDSSMEDIERHLVNAAEESFLSFYQELEEALTAVGQGQIDERHPLQNGLNRFQGFFQRGCGALKDDLERYCSDPVTTDDIPMNHLFAFADHLSPAMSATILQCQEINRFVEADPRFQGFSLDDLSHALAQVDQFGENTPRENIGQIFVLRGHDDFLNLYDGNDPNFSISSNSLFSSSVAASLMNTLEGMDNDTQDALDRIVRSAAREEQTSAEALSEFGTSRAYDHETRIIRTSHESQRVVVPTSAQIIETASRIESYITPEQRRRFTSLISRPPRDIFSSQRGERNVASNPGTLSRESIIHGQMQPNGASLPYQRISPAHHLTPGSTSYYEAWSDLSSFQERQLAPRRIMNTPYALDTASRHELDSIKSSYDQTLSEYEQRVRARQQDLESLQGTLGDEQTQELQRMIASLQNEIEELRSSRDQLAQNAQDQSLAHIAQKEAESRANDRHVSTPPPRRPEIQTPTAITRPRDLLSPPPSSAVNPSPTASSSLAPTPSTLPAGAPRAANTAIRDFVSPSLQLVETESADSNIRMSAQDFQRLSTDDLRELINTSTEHPLLEVTKVVSSDQGESVEIIELYEAKLDGDEVSLRLISSQRPVGRSIASTPERFIDEGAQTNEHRQRLVRHRELLDHLDRQIGDQLGL